MNLSHTTGLIAVLLSDLCFSGVDVERSSRNVDPKAIAHRYFSEPESAALLSLSDPLARARFFDLWTLKEAFIKAKGMGLAIPLADFSFDPDTAPLGVSFAPTLNEVSTHWWFHRFDFGVDHRVALAARTFGQTPTVTLYRLDDLRSLPSSITRRGCIADLDATVLSPA